MSGAKHETRVLVALQDLEQMIREAEDPANRAKLEQIRAAGDRLSTPTSP